MAKSKENKVSREGENDKMEESLKCFENQPNINMTIPWIYEIAKSMTGSRDGSDDDDVEKDLQCFLNQPNINMTIPWIYQIYKSVKSGGGGQTVIQELEWEEQED
jgi:hypothetical protein